MNDYVYVKKLSYIYKWSMAHNPIANFAHTCKWQSYEVDPPVLIEVKTILAREDAPITDEVNDLETCRWCRI